MIQFIPKASAKKLTFKDVPCGQFFVTESGSLFQKVTYKTANRIAVGTGAPDPFTLDFHSDAGIERIIEIEKIEF